FVEPGRSEGGVGSRVCTASAAERTAGTADSSVFTVVSTTLVTAVTPSSTVGGAGGGAGSCGLAGGSPSVACCGSFFGEDVEVRSVVVVPPLEDGGAARTTGAPGAMGNVSWDVEIVRVRRRVPVDVATRP